MGTFARWMAPLTAWPPWGQAIFPRKWSFKQDLAGRIRAAVSSVSDHHQIDAAIFEAFPCQSIPRHLLDPVPVLTEVARGLMLGRKLGLQAASLARISVCDFKKHCLVPLFKLRRCSRFIAHRLFLCERWQSQIVGIGQPCTLSAALLCRTRI